MNTTENYMLLMIGLLLIGLIWQGINALKLAQRPPVIHQTVVQRVAKEKRKKQ